MKFRLRSIIPKALVAAAAAGAVVGVVGHIGGAGAAPDDRTGAVAKFLDRPAAQVQKWVRVPSSNGDRFKGALKGVGLVTVDAKTLEVNEIIYNDRLVKAPASGPVAQADALSTAQQFAASHFAGFGNLSAHSAQYLDHGAFQEWRFVWQAKRGPAWLPEQVAVGVNPAGAVAYYWSQRTRTSIDGTPAVSAPEARTSALDAAHLTGRPAKTTDPELQVLVDHGRERLVWVTEVTAIP